LEALQKSLNLKPNCLLPLPLGKWNSNIRQKDGFFLENPARGTSTPKRKNEDGTFMEGSHFEEDARHITASNDH